MGYHRGSSSQALYSTNFSVDPKHTLNASYMRKTYAAALEIELRE